MTLEAFFKENPKTALAFSGGVDSSYLLYAAMQAGAEVRAYYVKTAFQPEFEYEDAMRLAKQLGAEVTVLRLDALCDPQVAANPASFTGQYLGPILKRDRVKSGETGQE